MGRSSLPAVSGIPCAEACSGGGARPAPISPPGVVAALVVAALLMPGTASADALLAAVGQGDATHVASLKLRIDFAPPLGRQLGNATAHVELGVVEFLGEQEHPRHAVTALNVTPVLRWRLGGGAARPLLEVGVGFSSLSRTLINGDRYFTTHLQFAELVGLAIEFGAKKNYEVGWRIEHMSNGGIREPNDGITYFSTHIAWRYR